MTRTWRLPVPLSSGEVSGTGVGAGAVVRATDGWGVEVDAAVRYSFPPPLQAKVATATRTARNIVTERVILRWLRRFLYRSVFRCSTVAPMEFTIRK